jgi:hypothetical protein
MGHPVRAGVVRRPGALRALVEHGRAGQTCRVSLLSGVLRYESPRSEVLLSVAMLVSRRMANFADAMN